MEGHAEAQLAGVDQSTALPHVVHPPYVAVAMWLFVVTAVEVAVTYVPGYVSDFAAFLLPVLLVLALIKGAGIALFYMHLKFDSRVFASFFLWGLVLAASMIIVFLGLFAYKGLT